MYKLLDAGCHVVATMWKALKSEWHWLGCAKPIECAIGENGVGIKNNEKFHNNILLPVLLSLLPTV